MRSYREVFALVYHAQHLFSILRLADAALSAARRANKGATSEAADAFLRVQKEMRRFGSPPPNDVPAPHRKILRDLSTAMEAASKKDEKSMGTLSKVNTAFMYPVSYLSESDDSTTHDTDPGFQGTHKESKLRDSQIAA